MGGRNKVDIVAAPSLKPDHSGCQFLIGVRGTVPLHADLIILTEDTFEIAMGEKNGSGAAAPHERRFLAIMREDARDEEARRCFTVPEHSLQPVNPAPARAQCAGGKALLQEMRPFFEN